MPHSKDRLAEELKNLGFPDCAELASQGYYDDFMSPLDAPALTLLADLARLAANYPSRSRAILALRNRAMDGEFDSTLDGG